MDSRKSTEDIGVQCLLLPVLCNAHHIDASVQFEIQPPLSTSTPPCYLVESSESDFSQADVEDAHADISFNLSQESAA